MRAVFFYTLLVSVSSLSLRSSQKLLVSLCDNCPTDEEYTTALDDGKLCKSVITPETCQKTCQGTDAWKAQCSKKQTGTGADEAKESDAEDDPADQTGDHDFEMKLKELKNVDFSKINNQGGTTVINFGTISGGVGHDVGHGCCATCDCNGAAAGPGRPGTPGKPGKDGRNGIDGTDGNNGKDGKDGKDGKNGKNGRVSDEDSPKAPKPPELSLQKKKAKQNERNHATCVACNSAVEAVAKNILSTESEDCTEPLLTEPCNQLVAQAKISLCKDTVLGNCAQLKTLLKSDQKEKFDPPALCHKWKLCSNKEFATLEAE